MEATPADNTDAAEVTTPLDAALPLILPFTSLQCKGRAQATSKIVRESVVVDELDACSSPWACAALPVVIGAGADGLVGAPTASVALVPAHRAGAA